MDVLRIVLSIWLISLFGLGVAVWQLRAHTRRIREDAPRLHWTRLLYPVHGVGYKRPNRRAA